MYVQVKATLGEPRKVKGYLQFGCVLVCVCIVYNCFDLNKHGEFSIVKFVFACLFHSTNWLGLGPKCCGETSRAQSTRPILIRASHSDTVVWRAWWGMFGGDICWNQSANNRRAAFTLSTETAWPRFSGSIRKHLVS